MRAIITTFDAQAMALTLAPAGSVEEAERGRLQELFRSSAVVEVHVGPAGLNGAAHVTLAAGIRTEDR